MGGRPPEGVQSSGTPEGPRPRTPKVGACRDPVVLFPVRLTVTHGVTLTFLQAPFTGEGLPGGTAVLLGRALLVGGAPHSSCHRRGPG